MQTDYIRPNKEEKREKLPGDYETPFSPPLDVPDNVPNDYPTKDTDMDSMEWYQNGGAVASGAEFPKRVKKAKVPKGFVTR